MSALDTGMTVPENSHAERRADPRFALGMLRTAKLLCESGEYVCVVRDISATGCKVRLFHEPPPDTHLFLELGNGERFAMERMWQDGGHAGFRFSSEIDVDEFIEEPSPYPRRPVRLRIERPAAVKVKGAERQVMLVNLSQHGARIETATPLAVCERLRLDVPGLPPRIGNVRWRKGFAHGLVFQQAFRLDEFARHAFDLQPYLSAAPAAGNGQSARVA